MSELGDPRGFTIARRTRAEAVRYLADQLREGQSPVAVAMTLEVLADAWERDGSEIAAYLRHVDTLDKVPGARAGLPRHNPLWDAANLIESEFGEAA